MNPDRDRIIEQALKHELRGALPPPGPACLDAETLGAWIDGGLAPVAMASAEAHVSTCARCQAMVGTFARAHAAVTPAVEAPRLRLWKWWLAPLAAGAAAVTLWMVVPPQREIATAPPTPVAAESTQPRTVPAEPVPAPAGRSANAVTAPARAANAPAQAAAAPAEERGRVARADRPEPPAELQASARDNRQQLKDDAGAKKEAATRAMPERALGAAQERAASADATALARAEAPAPAAPIAALEKNARFADAPFEVISPDRTRRWRIARDGIERSEDGGITWIIVRVASGDTITNGHAPTGSICWLVGRDGVVLVTADGFTFARVPLPERIALTGVSATDARSATVTAGDGRRFRTDDSGRTWRPL